MTQKRLDITGHRFTRLIALEYSHFSKNTSWWKCKCDCGKEKILRLKDLRSGTVRSCGCLMREVTKQINSKPPGISALNSLFHSYKIGAKKRKLEFNINKDFFQNITKQNCYYCNSEPSNKIENKNHPNGGYTYNGIDRLNNDLGYNQENCVPCCKNCNLAKRSMTPQDFYNWISKLISHRNSLINSQLPPMNTPKSREIWPLVIKDMQERNESGIKKYGTSLKSFNTRNALVDSYQEILDLTVYIRQFIEEQNNKCNFCKAHICS